MRYLGVVRLSNATEETTSPERQRRSIEAWAEREGHQIVGWAEDLGVSGSVSPWKRPSLGPWFARTQEFDGIAVWRIDRLARRVLHFASLLDWCRENEKMLASATEPFDLATPLGRMFAQMIAMLAEGELEAIKERASNSQEHLRKVGRWRGGSPPYGYRPEPISGGPGWTLAADDEARSILQEIIARVTDGQSIASIASDLNRRGVPSPRDHHDIRQGKPAKGRAWEGETINRMLRSRAMLGQLEHNGKVIRGDDGLPVQRAEPLVHVSDWDALQKAMDSASRPKTRTNGASPLLNVAVCFDCGSLLHRHVMVKPGQEYRYYRCAGRTRMGNGCTARAIRADVLESVLERELMKRVGHLPHTVKTIIPGEDHTAELEQVERALVDLREDRAAGLFIGDRGAAEYRAMYRALEEKRTALAELPVVPDREVDEPTGRTIAEEWARLAPKDRRQFLINSEITVAAKGGTAEQGVAIEICLPMSLEERASELVSRGPART